MRAARRLLGLGAVNHYHVVSRVVDRRKVLGEREKRVFRDFLGRQAAFSGIRVLTYCLMGNHFHLLLEVRDAEGARFREEATDGELMERVRALYPAVEANRIAAELRGLREAGREKEAEEMRHRFFRRMDDLSEFVRELKWRFSVWFNRTHDRTGALWEDRFRSVLVEGRTDAPTAKTSALETVAAYIDLNPVRAGMVRDPRRYPFSGLGEASGGGAFARQGIRRLSRTWTGDGAGAGEAGKALERYTRLVAGFVDPGAGNPGAGGGGEAPLLDPIRAFSRGGAVGSRAFVDEVFRAHRSRFGGSRSTGARPVRGSPGGTLKALRDLDRKPDG